MDDANGRRQKSLNGLEGVESKQNGGVSSRFGVGQTNQHGTVASGEEDARVVIVLLFFPVRQRQQRGLALVGLVVCNDMVPYVGGDGV